MTLLADGPADRRGDGAVERVVQAGPVEATRLDARRSERARFEHAVPRLGLHRSTPAQSAHRWPRERDAEPRIRAVDLRAVDSDNPSEMHLSLDRHCHRYSSLRPDADQSPGMSHCACLAAVHARAVLGNMRVSAAHPDWGYSFGASSIDFHGAMPPTSRHALVSYPNSATAAMLGMSRKSRPIGAARARSTSLGSGGQIQHHAARVLVQDLARQRDSTFGRSPHPGRHSIAMSRSSYPISRAMACAVARARTAGLETMRSGSTGSRLASGCPTIIRVRLSAIVQ